MGNINETYRKELRAVRPAVELAHERLLCFKSELDRDSENVAHKDKTVKLLRECGDTIGHLLLQEGLNMPPAERESIRTIKEELAVSRGFIQDFDVTKATADAERVIVAQITSTMENVREWCRWADGRLEKKWWLAELFKYARTLLLIATFVSATLGVAYPTIMGPVVTLIFTIASGVIDILEQVLVKGNGPSQLDAYRKRGRINPSQP